MSELDFEWQPVNPTGTNDFASQFAADAWKPPEHLLSIKWGADFRASAAQLAAADSASDATSVAVAAPDVVTPTDSAAPTDSVAPPTPTISNPNDFFICQFRDARFNPGGPPSSEDCGPTSLAMIARYYGATDDPAKLVSDVRFAMTGGRNSNEGTTLGEVKRGAEKLGLATEPVSDMQSLNSSLDAGHMVVLAGNPRDYEKQLGLHYGKGAPSTMAVTSSPSSRTTATPTW
jgi:hypothetical protein